MALDDDAASAQRVVAELVKLRFQLGHVGHQCLPRSADSAGPLEPHAAVLPQALRGIARILARKRGVTRQRQRRGVFRECGGPAGRLGAGAFDQTMGDHLGRDERKRHDATEQVPYRSDPEFACLRHGERIVRDHVTVCRVSFRPAELARKPCSLQCGDLRAELAQRVGDMTDVRRPLVPKMNEDDR
ncbi:hypothetical protein ABIC49_004030 [Burkholderia ambifaria]